MRFVFSLIKICFIVFSLFVILLLSVSADNSADKRHLDTYVLECLELRMEKIPLLEFRSTTQEVFDAIDRIMKSNPKLYYVENAFFYTEEGGFVRDITPNYKYSAEQTRNIRTFCDGEIERIIFSIDEDMSDFAKALVLHEYMCENFSYDYAYENYTMYDLLRTGRGTCQAFALTYMELLDRVGIESSYAYSNEIMHIWNLVCIDGEWYHVDITWDDGSGHISHKNFLLTDEEIEASGHIRHVNADGILCNDVKYAGAAFRESRGKYVPLGEGFIYIDNASRSMYYDLLDGSEKTLVYRIDELWEKGEGRYYASSFSSAVSAGNKVYFNTKSGVWAIDEGGEVSFVCGLDFAAWGIIERAGGLVCFLDRAGENERYIGVERSFDADGDGEVTVLDMALLSRYFSSSDVRIYKYNVDADRNFKIDEKDISALKERLLYGTCD